MNIYIYIYIYIHTVFLITIYDNLNIIELLESNQIHTPLIEYGVEPEVVNSCLSNNIQNPLSILLINELFDTQNIYITNSIHPKKR